MNRIIHRSQTMAKNTKRTSAKVASKAAAHT